MTPPAPTPEEVAYILRDCIVHHPPDIDLMERLTHALAVAHARGRAEGLEAAAQAALEGRG